VSRLKLRFLGPPEVRYRDRPLSFPSRKALALLVYLAVEGGVQPRDKLAALLWPESDASRARATLRNGLHQLRSTLPDDSILHVERDTLAFNAGAGYDLDLDVVAQATEAISLESSPSATVDQLRAAVEVYRGDFLEGFSLGDAPAFEDWAVVRRERWHRRMDDVYDALSEIQFEQGRVQAGLETAGDWRAHNPFNEKACRRLMRLHLAADNRAAALQTYEQCRDTLQTELGATPAPETEALAAQVRAADPAVRQHTAADRPESPAASEEPRFADGPLVGRSAEFETLVADFHRAAADGPQIGIIVGQAGMGKTRLAHDFLAWAQAQGAAVLRGRSFESSRQLPYQPLVEALRPRVERTNAPEDLLSDAWLAELSRLLPELLDRYPDLQTEARPQVEESAARTRLFEAITRLVHALAQRLSQGAPLVVFLDDLQWADAATLDVLQYAGRRWQEQETPLLLLCAARSEALHPMSVAHAPHLAECLEQLERTASPTQLRLEPLTEADTADFVQAFGASDDSQFVQWLFHETNGQPFYLVETLNDLSQQGALQTHVDAEGQRRLRTQVPTGGAGATMSTGAVVQKVRRLIGGRLARLSAGAFDLLAAGAVLARDFTFERLCRVAGLDEGEGLRALDELLHSQLLVEQPAETGAPYVFAHDKIRDVVYTEAGEARRRVFHRRALAALEQDKEPPAQLAHHALAAGEKEAAFNYSLAAGDEALHLYAAQEAIAHYEQARATGDRLQLTNDRLRNLYLPLGRAYELAGDYDRALAVYDELQALARERGHKPLQLAALMARTTVYAAPTQHYDPQNVTLLTEQALPLAQELGDHDAESKIQWNLMLLKLFTGDIEKAVSHGEASLALAREHDLRQRMAYALHDLTRAYLFSGRPQKGIAAGQEAQALWRELENKAMLADNLISTASAMNFWQGAYEESIPQLQEALALSREIDNLWNQSYAQHILGTVYFDQGRFGRAIAACEEAVELGRQAGFMVPLFTNGSLLAWIYGILGCPQRGFPWVEQALEKAPETQMRDQRVAPLAAGAFLHLCQGRLDEAEEWIEKAYEYMALQSLSVAAFFTFAIDGRLRLAREEYERAIEVADDYFEYLQQRRLRPFRSDALYVKGRACLALGRHDEAQAALARAREEAQALNARRVLWEVLAALAELADRRGETETAHALRRYAREILQTIVDDVDDPQLRQHFLERPVVQVLVTP
jgi:DNA-binding SARP family transcriptional activator